jgi:hypothetical protein
MAGKMLLGRVPVVPGGVELRPRRSLEVRGSPELQNGGLRALEEAWDDFLLEAFSCQVWSFSALLGRLKVVPGGVEVRPRRSLEVRGSPELQNGAPRALKELLDDFLLEAFSCQVWSFSVLLGRLKVSPGGVEVRPRRSLEVRGSPELQNGALRALEELFDDFLLEAFSCQVWSFSVLLGRLQESPEVPMPPLESQGMPRSVLEFPGVPRPSQGMLPSLFSRLFLG